MAYRRRGRRNLVKCKHCGRYVSPDELEFDTQGDEIGCMYCIDDPNQYPPAFPDPPPTPDQNKE